MTDVQILPSRLGRYAVLSVSGDLNVSDTGQARAALHAAVADTESSGVILDLSRLTFCDSSGLSTLIAAFKHARSRDLPFVIAGAHGRVARVLHLTGIDQHIPLHPDLPQAQDHLDTGAHRTVQEPPAPQ